MPQLKLMTLHLRPISLFDPDSESYWTRTKGLTRPEEKSSLSSLPSEEWGKYREDIESALKNESLKQGFYLYKVQDLEHIITLIDQVNISPPNMLLANKIYLHLAANWDEISKILNALVANIDTSSPARRKPPRAKAEELVEFKPNLWMWRLQRLPWVPSTVVPRNPDATWDNDEVRNRFRGINGKSLLPILDLDIAINGSKSIEILGKSGALAVALGINRHIHNGCLTVKDIKRLLLSLYNVCGSPMEGETIFIGSQDQRSYIGPCFRHMFEFLPDLKRQMEGADRFRQNREELSELPLLCLDTKDRLHFRKAKDCFVANRRGTRGRLSEMHGVSVFYLEGHPGAVAPLREFFNVRELENQIGYQLNVQEISDDENCELIEEKWRRFIEDLNPYILCRLQVERASEELQRKDAKGLALLLKGIQAFENIQVEAYLRKRGGQLSSIPALSKKDTHIFLNRVGNKPPSFFVTPKSLELLNGNSHNIVNELAQIISDLLGVSHIEALINLIAAKDRHHRIDLLRLAGAPWQTEDLNEKALFIKNEEKPNQDNLPQKSYGNDLSVEASRELTQQLTGLTSEGKGTDQTEKTIPLYNLQELKINNKSIIILGESLEKASPESVHGRKIHAGRGGGFSRSSDLVDKIGMAVAMVFEQERVGLNNIFDISEEDKLNKAKEDFRVMRALEQLSLKGHINLPHPGCDFLSLDKTTGKLDRLIELKSSGYDTSYAKMTWNEWKSARNSAVRQYYYLYIIGNLRKDVSGLPYIRIYNDPFGQLFSEEKSQVVRKKEVQLYLDVFKKLEQVEIEVSLNKQIV